MVKETRLGYSTTQIIFFRKKNFLIMGLTNGIVLVWHMDRLLSEGKLPGKKMIRLFENIHYK